MCRAWPGFRCSNHPSKKVRQQYRQVWNATNTYKKAAALAGQYASTHGEGWEDTEEGAELLRGEAEAQAKLENLKESLNEAKDEYNLTLKGREELKEKEESSDPREATSAAAELNAAETRIEQQKEIADVLRNSEIPAPETLYVARRTAKVLNRELAELRNSYAENKTTLGALLQIRDRHRENGSEIPESLKERIATAMKEEARLKERISQTERHREATLAWLSRRMEKRLENAILTADKLSDKLFDYILP